MAEATSTLNSLYPQPPSQQQGLFSGDPAKAIGTLNALQELMLRGQTFPALSQQPAATLQGTQIQNQTNLQDQQDAARRMIANRLATSLSGLENPNENDVHNNTTYLSRSHHDINARYPDMIPAAADFLLKHPSKNLKKAVGELLNMGLSPGEASGLVEGPPGPGGTPRKYTVPESNLMGAGGRNVGQSVGMPIIQKGASERAEALNATGSSSNRYHTSLDNLKQYSRELGTAGGPTLDWEMKLGQVASRLGVGKAATLTPEQLKAAEGFNKQLSGIIDEQSAALGGNTDMARATRISANPNLIMSQKGRDAQIDMIHGSQDAVDRVRSMWLDSKRPPEDFDYWIHDLSKTFNPRVFQLNRLSAEDQRTFLDHVEDTDYEKFKRQYQEGVDKGWVKPIKKLPNAGK